MFEFDIKNVMGKENKLVDSLSRKVHMEAINTCQTGLRMKISKATVRDEFFLQVKE